MQHGSIAFYIHHQGRGHSNRAWQIVNHTEGDLYVLGSDLSYFEAQPLPSRIHLVHLAQDTVPSIKPASDWAASLHYAPTGIPGIGKRMLRIANCLIEDNIKLLIVDVSVEIAMLSRLLGIPYIYMRQHGYRNDLGHLTAYQNAKALLAPYPKSWESPGLPDWTVNKTFYAGGFSRFANFQADKSDQQLHMDRQQKNVVVMSGFGGNEQFASQVADAARLNPNWQWWVIGPGNKPVSVPDNLHILGVVEQPYNLLNNADVVVASAGNNTVMELAELKARYICIPESRHYDEQLEKARLLAKKNAALVLQQWPSPYTWHNHFKDVMKTDTEALYSIIEDQAAKKAATFIQKNMD